MARLSLLSAVVLPVMAGFVALRAEDRFRIVPDASGEITFFIGDAADKSGYRSGDADLMVWALQEWERRIAVRFRRVDEQQRARLRVRWLPWSEDAALGRMQPSTEDGHAVVSLDIRPDENRFRPTVWRRVREDPLMRDVVIYYVCLHEIGHALGISHSDNPRDVMWPGTNGVTLPIYERYRHHLMTRDDIPRVEWLSTHDVDRVKALFASGTPSSHARTPH
jgi:Matrixin